MKRIYIILFLITSGVWVNAQDSTLTKSKWQLNGYIKEMGAVHFDKDNSDPVFNNLLHNRINSKWNPGKSITASLEVRNRVFRGDKFSSPLTVYNSSLRNGNEWLNLSAKFTSHNNFVFQSNIDRAWVEFRESKWNVRLGRQRINWGLTTVWNPNDIFNPYNFLDFDYEERPGADAVKLQYGFSDSSGIDIVVNPYGNIKRSVAAARYSVDKRGYHLQMIAGIYQNKLTAGFGWVGRYGRFNYKGEGQVFVAEKDSLNRFNYSLELSYLFRNGWFLSGSALHNTSGLSEPVINPAKLNFQSSPTNPMPARWSFVTITSKEFTSLFSGNLTLVYSPQVNLFIVYPAFKYKLLPKLDADLIYQSFFLEQQGKFQAASHTIFLRLKWIFNAGCR